MPITAQDDDARAPTAAPTPNLLVILVDDLGAMDVGCANPDTFYETPNIDRLAAAGVRFTNAYAACPVCSPSRAALLTGRHPPRTGITDYIGAPQPEKWTRKTRLRPAPYVGRLALGEITLAEVAKAARRHTFFAGKWHLGGRGFWPEDQGFDVNRGGIDRGGPYGGDQYFSPYGNPRLRDGPPGEHLPARLAQETVAFMAEHKDEPFFALLSFYSVHTPLMARADLVAKYEAKAKALPPHEPVFGEEGARKVRLVQDHAVYAGMVEAMDEAVGVVLDALARLRLDERTVVIFTSDNGGLSTSEGHPTANLPLRAGKGWLYEGGVRVPLVVRAPGLTRKGETSAVPATGVDVFTTALLCAGMTPPPGDGVDLRPALRGEALTRGPLFWHYPHYGNQGGAPGSAIRVGDWKLIEWFERDACELFDLAEDPGEALDIAAQYPERVADLRAQLAAWRSAVAARMPVPTDRR